MNNFFIWKSCLFLRSIRSQNSTTYNNFTIEWDDFNLLTCATPTYLNFSFLTCMNPNYTQIDDSSCLATTTINFDDTSCTITTTSPTTTQLVGQTTTTISQQTTVRLLTTTGQQTSVGMITSTIQNVNISTTHLSNTTQLANTTFLASTTLLLNTTLPAITTYSATTTVNPANTTTYSATTTVNPADTTTYSATTTVNSANTTAYPATTTVNPANTTTYSATTTVNSVNTTTYSATTTVNPANTTTYPANTTQNIAATNTTVHLVADTTGQNLIITDTTTVVVSTIQTLATTQVVNSHSQSDSIYTTVLSTISTTTTQNFQGTCDGDFIGPYCNVSSDACAMSQPCQNAATCYPNNTLPLRYVCTCVNGYVGYDCQYDIRACKENTCWHNGTCLEVNKTISVNSTNNFHCECVEGYDGVHCELEVDDCSNVTCQNHGFCVSTLNSWHCICLDTNYYNGVYCQYKSQSLIIKEWVAKSFAIVAIGSIIAVCLFVIIMDVMKYVFKIDPVYENEKLRKARYRRDHPRKPKPVQVDNKTLALRFQYVK
ncbi:unnamed protein product [Didymodactylos carnosus]|uniref:EGF-like domain-containing protein n=1 Tax=Didymodactylos carnosus TaxID=1234261 RepID=A0A815LZC8_9BILA|nr:unnamed protein product [Didymodactylos carnosus]CAF4301260.1 unnamed protein product [Didymodactylos carnosus]